MTNNQESRVDMHLTVIEYSEGNESITTNLPEYSSNFGVLAETNTQIQRIGEQQKMVLTGITLDKNQVRANLILYGADTARKLTSYAKLTGNLTLLDEVNFSETDFRRFSDIKLRDYTQIIFNKASDLLESLVQYGISASSQETLQNAINSFNSVLAAPRIGTMTKSQATKQLVTLFKTADATLAQMDAAVEIVKLTEPNFYMGYKAARKVISKGVGKLAVKGMVADAQSGEPVKGVTVSFSLDGDMVHLSAAKNGKPVAVKTTAAKGGFNIKSLAAGTYAVSFKKAGYAEQTATLNVNDGEMTVVEVKLVKN